MKKNIYILTALLLSSVFVINSCKKADVDNDTQSAIDNGICEQEFTKITPNVNGRAIKENGVQKTHWGSCPDVYVDPADTLNGFPVTMWLIYDTTTAGNGCLGDDGKLRKGKIKCVFNKPWHKDTIGNNLTNITFYDYKVNGIKYEGTVIISKPSQYAYRTQVISGKCTKDASWELFWDCDRTITWTAGMGDTIVSNDVYSVTGNASGINRNGTSYTANIVSAIVKSNSCAYIQEGILDITPQGRPTRTLDYGDGTCDNKATVTINGNTYNITLN